MKRGNYMNVFSPEGGKNFHFFFLGDSINTNTEVLLLRHH